MAGGYRRQIATRGELAMNVLESSTRIAFKNILFLTDFSEASQTALEYAAMLAKHHNATLYPAHVQTPTTPIYTGGAALMKYLDVAESRLEKN